MEDTKDTNPTPGTQISAEQAGEVGGGTDCSASVSVGGINSPAPTVGQAIINLYDGAVEATTHVIETVAHAAK